MATLLVLGNFVLINLFFIKVAGDMIKSPATFMKDIMRNLISMGLLGQLICKRRVLFFVN